MNKEGIIGEVKGNFQADNKNKQQDLYSNTKKHVDIKAEDKFSSDKNQQNKKKLDADKKTAY